MAINDVVGKGCIMYEILFVNFLVTILCPIFVYTLKTKKIL